MRRLLINTLFLGLFLKLSFVMAATGSPYSEAENNLFKIKKLELPIAMGVDVENNRYAQSVYAHDFVELAKAYPEIMFNNDLMGRWFNLEVSRNSNHHELIKQYLGMQIVVRPDMGAFYRHISSQGIYDFLGKAFPGKSSFALQTMALDWAHEWKNEFLMTIRNGDMEVREKALKLIFRSDGRPYEIVRITEFVLKEMSLEQKIRFANDIHINPDSKARVMVAHVFLEKIPFKEFTNNYRTLFSNLLTYASWSPESSFKVSEWLARTPSAATAKIPLTWIETNTAATTKLLNNSTQFTVAEQLFLLFENFRAPLLNTYIVEANGEAGLRLFDLALEFGIKPDFSFGQALAQEWVSQEARWVEWMHELTPKLRGQLLARFINSDALYKGTSDRDFELQRKFLNDAKKHAAKGQGFLALVNFVTKSSGNERLVERMVESWGVRFIQSEHKEVVRAFVENTFFHPQVVYETRIQWLAIIMERNITDEKTLKRLADGFGKEREALRDLIEAGRSETMKVDFLKQILGEVLIENRTQSPHPFCLRIFRAH